MLGLLPTAMAEPGTEPTMRSDSAATGWQPSERTAAPPQASAEETEEKDAIPELADPHRFRRLRRALLVSGLTAWGAAYCIVAVVAFSALCTDHPNATGWLLVPLVGPWMTLALRHPCREAGADASFGCCDGVFCTSAVALLIGDGLLQAAGAALTTVALVLPRDRALARTTPMIAPYALPNGAGVLMAGTF